MICCKNIVDVAPPLKKIKCEHFLQCSFADKYSNPKPNLYVRNVPTKNVLVLVTWLIGYLS